MFLTKVGQSDIINFINDMVYVIECNIYVGKTYIWIYACMSGFFT